jgi:hypothetical protein
MTISLPGVKNRLSLTFYSAIACAVQDGNAITALAAPAAAQLISHVLLVLVFRVILIVQNKWKKRLRPSLHEGHERY